MTLSPGQKWWYDKIEQRAYSRLARLRLKTCEEGMPLWDGLPPVPVEHVAEHVLGLSISYEIIHEAENEEILGCIRPESREIVLNDRHSKRFGANPGIERFTIAHECGHADVFGDVILHSGESLFTDKNASRPKRSAEKGPVTVLKQNRTRDVFGHVTKGLSRTARTKLMHQLKEKERAAIADGADSALVRRAVDHYAAVLLMPADLVRAVVKNVNLKESGAIRTLAEKFSVSRQAMSIQLEYLGLIYGIDDHGSPVLKNPKHANQIELL